MSGSLAGSSDEPETGEKASGAAVSTNPEYARRRLARTSEAIRNQQEGAGTPEPINPNAPKDRARGFPNETELEKKAVESGVHQVQGAQESE